MFVNSINHFRGIAIFIIVLGHVIAIKTTMGDSFFESWIMNVLAGGTHLFVFISGFLFYVVFYKNYDFPKFLASKIKNLLIPYTILSILPIYSAVTSDWHHWHEFFVPDKGSIAGEYVIPIIKNYVTGDFLLAYWYIPFIIVMFSLSPLHVAFIRLSERRQAAIIAILFVLSLFAHRPAFNLNPLHSVLYFMPVYLIGIWCAVHRFAIYNTLRGKEAFLLVAVILLALLQTLLGRTGNYFKDLLIYDGLDLMLIQKTCMSLFLMVWLYRFEHVKHLVLSTLASTSFAIFFLHGYVIWLVERFSFVTAMPDFTYFLLSALVVAISAAIAMVSKRLLHGYSRYVTGY